MRQQTQQTQEPEQDKWHLRQRQGVWSVLETPCYPRSFKVVHSTYRKQSNDFSEFFYTFKEAQVEASKRNGFDYANMKRDGARRIDRCPNQTN